MGTVRTGWYAAKPGEGTYSPAKDAHIRACLTRNVESLQTNGLEHFKLAPGFPGFHLSAIETRTRFLNREVGLPLLVSPITGGGRQSLAINRNIALAAEALRIPVAVGSQRPLLEGRAAADSYRLRQWAPTVPLLANLGLVHIVNGKEYLREAVSSIGADAVILYANPLHEILQREGEGDFAGLLERLDTMLGDLPFPVFLKEVGFGLPDTLIEWASSRPIAGIDTAGVGGTNWVRIEGLLQGRDYGVYEELGRSTARVLVSARDLLRPDQCLIASGGIRTGVEMAKCLALGASLCGMALPFLRWASISADRVIRGVEQIKEELTTAMWFCGARRPDELRGALSGSP